MYLSIRSLFFSICFFSALNIKSFGQEYDDQALENGLVISRSGRNLRLLAQDEDSRGTGDEMLQQNILHRGITDTNVIGFLPKKKHSKVSIGNWNKPEIVILKTGQKSKARKLSNTKPIVLKYENPLHLKVKPKQKVMIYEIPGKSQMKEEIKVTLQKPKKKFKPKSQSKMKSKHDKHVKHMKSVSTEIIQVPKYLSNNKHITVTKYEPYVSQDIQYSDPPEDRILNDWDQNEKPNQNIDPLPRQKTGRKYLKDPSLVEKTPYLEFPRYEPGDSQINQYLIPQGETLNDWVQNEEPNQNIEPLPLPCLPDNNISRKFPSVFPQQGSNVSYVMMVPFNPETWLKSKRVLKSMAQFRKREAKEDPRKRFGPHVNNKNSGERHDLTKRALRAGQENLKMIANVVRTDVGPSLLRLTIDITCVKEDANLPLSTRQGKPSSVQGADNPYSYTSKKTLLINNNAQNGRDNPAHLNPDPPLSSRPWKFVSVQGPYNPNPSIGKKTLSINNNVQNGRHNSAFLNPKGTPVRVSNNQFHKRSDEPPKSYIFPAVSSRKYASDLRQPVHENLEYPALYPTGRRREDKDLS